MKLIRFTAALVAALTFAACATKPPEPVVDFAPDYNFSQPKTIGFYAMSGEVTGNNPTELTDFQRDRIDDAFKVPSKRKDSCSSTKPLTPTCS